MDQHLKILGILHIAWNLFSLIIGGCVVVFVVWAGLISGEGGEIAFTSLVALVIGAALLVFVVPGLVGGIGILYRKSWARIILLIYGALSLLNFPFGTALGIYTFWVLLNDETQRLLT